MKKLSICGGLNGGCGTKIYPISTKHMLNDNNIQFTKENPEEAIKLRIHTIEQLNSVVQKYDELVDKYDNRCLIFTAIIVIMVIILYIKI